MKRTACILSLAGLVLTVLPSCLVFAGIIGWRANVQLMFAGMVLWFVFAPLWMRPARS